MLNIFKSFRCLDMQQIADKENIGECNNKFVYQRTLRSYHWKYKLEEVG